MTVDTTPPDRRIGCDYRQSPTAFTDHAYDIVAARTDRRIGRIEHTSHGWDAEYADTPDGPVRLIATTTTATAAVDTIRAERARVAAERAADQPPCRLRQSTLDRLAVGQSYRAAVTG